jgi:hypothetical protein
MPNQSVRSTDNSELDTWLTPSAREYTAPPGATQYTLDVRIERYTKHASAESDFARYWLALAQPISADWLMHTTPVLVAARAARSMYITINSDSCPLVLVR